MEQQGYLYIITCANLTNASCMHFAAKESGLTVSCAKMYEDSSPLILPAPELWCKTGLVKSFITQLLKAADES